MIFRYHILLLYFFPYCPFIGTMLFALVFYTILSPQKKELIELIQVCH